MEVTRYKGRFWAVYDGSGQLVVVTVYKRGANEVKRRLYQASVENSVSPEATSKSDGRPSVSEKSFSRNKRP